MRVSEKQGYWDVWGPNFDTPLQPDTQYTKKTCNYTEITGHPGHRQQVIPTTSNRPFQPRATGHSDHRPFQPRNSVQSRPMPRTANHRRASASYPSCYYLKTTPVPDPNIPSSYRIDKLKDKSRATRWEDILITAVLLSVENRAYNLLKYLGWMN